MSDNQLILRSYRLAFEVERRLHRIDRFRIPVPYGIPLVALAYWAAVMAVFLLLGTLPIAGVALGALPWPVRLVLLPGLVTRALCRPRPDGRPTHEAIAAYVAFLVSARHLVGLAPPPRGHGWLGAVAIAADEHAVRSPRGVVRGPCTVVLQRAARLELRARAVSLALLDRDDELQEPQAVALSAGARMEVSPCGRR
ncbi:MAG TPA: TcpE family conjugal transfer membrane protein [Baekduia sp.]|uniref:TcpE family conjugal transfer membrane protein n=1 Tax=Baekduia sp. TaxID=2600305 RepID=UPI002D797FF6|nr:TcpE family conjugal transfer membrane protein [Baekduia sp.]HET6507393.1 TcpE family conjugal transfer membrane protein [Baekduia sp.]